MRRTGDPGRRVGRTRAIQACAASLAMVLLLQPAAARAAPEAVPLAPPGNASFGAIGVAVDDGMGYGDGAAAARTPAYFVQALMASGHFASVGLNRFDLPQQLRIKVRAKPAGSAEAAAGRLIAGAATLFLLPMKQTNDYAFEFEVECRGRSMGQWTHTSTLEQTQFLLADPHRGLPALVNEAVAQFIRLAVESGKLATACT